MDPKFTNLKKEGKAKEGKEGTEIIGWKEE